MKSKLLILIFLFFSIYVFASESNGKVIDYWIHNNHDSFAFSIENQNDRPKCATFGLNSGRYVIDISTERGKLVASSIMAAKLANSNIRAQGTNTCNYYGDSEDLLWIQSY